MIYERMFHTRNILRILLQYTDVTMRIKLPFPVGNDSLFLNITLHICGQVKILKANFVNFDVTSPRVYDRFNALIQRHGHLMTLAKKLADTISFVLLMQLFVSSILLCIIGEKHELRHYIAILLSRE